MRRLGKRRREERRTELNSAKDLALERIGEPLPDDPRFCLFRLESREVVEVGLARVFALEDAVEEEGKAGGVGSIERVVGGCSGGEKLGRAKTGGREARKVVRTEEGCGENDEEGERGRWKREERCGRAWMVEREREAGRRRWACKIVSYGLVEGRKT